MTLILYILVIFTKHITNAKIGINYFYSYKQQENNNHKKSKMFQHIKGGAIPITTTIIPTKNITVIVSTSLGSSFLDKTKKISINPNSTIKELKYIIQDKFPGSPPIQIQRLFYAFKPLNNSDILSNITTASQVPILLDALSGTSAYNKTLSITQAIEAYVSIIVQQTYLSSTMQKAFDLKDSSTLDLSEVGDRDRIDTLTLRDLFAAVNQSIYAQYAEQIAEALEKEREPDMITADTIAWRQQSEGAADKNPLVVEWAKMFNMNKQVALSLVYYSVILVVSISDYVMLL